MIIDIKNDSDVALLKKATEGRVVGLTSGCYDIFHHLHLVYLQRCAGLCDILIVGVDSNDLIGSFKGPDRPIVPEHQRVSIISALSCVQVAFVMRSVEDFGRAVEQLSVSKIFKNQGEFYGKPIEGADKAEVIFIPDIINYSSTSQIIDEVAKNVTLAKKNQKPEPEEVAEVETKVEPEPEEVVAAERNIPKHNLNKAAALLKGEYYDRFATAVWTLGLANDEILIYTSSETEFREASQIFKMYNGLWHGHKVRVENMGAIHPARKLL